MGVTQLRTTSPTRVLHFLQASTAVALALALGSCSGGGGGSTLPRAGKPSSGGAPISPAALTAFPEIASIGGTATVILQARFDAQNRPAFFWNGSRTTPTIRVHPGDTLDLTFENQLPEFCSVGVVSNANLHFHGLTSSPNPPGDDTITTNAAPGADVNYRVHINPDQPPGLYWYHPHAHGLASYEVGNGMAGAIVVEGIAGYVAQTAGLRERIIILGDIPNSPTFEAGEESVLRRTAGRRASGSRGALDADSPSGGNACAPETDATPTINGASLASIGIKPGETELLRVLNASGHRFFDLAVDGRQLTLVAQDGVPLNTYPGAPATLALNDIVVAPAGRVEFLVTGGAAPAALISKCVATGPDGDTAPEVALGVLTDDSRWPDATAAAATTRVAKPSSVALSSYYHSLLPAPAQTRTIHFSEDANGFYLNGAAYDPNAGPGVVAKSGTVEEWTLENDSGELHAFHIHQTHFIVESVNGVPQANRHWVDTVTLAPQGVGVGGQRVPSQTKVLVDFRDPAIRGTFLFHCHILDHEDGGMMAKITVL